jgi:hypothetical protein
VSQTPIAETGLLAAAARVPDHVVFRGFAAETVVLNLETGKYHGLNPVGGRMLDTVAVSENLATAAGALAEEYGEAVEVIESDLCAFCAALAERGLIEIVPTGR